MAAIVLCLVLFLAVTGYSEATYCMCNDGLSDTVYQTDIDYACSKVSCSAIMQNGVCYQPNTKKDHCNYAVNNYYQAQNQAPLACNFTGSCTVTSTLATTNTNCVYPANPSSAVTGGSTSTNGTTPSTGTGTGIITGTTPSTGTSTGTTTGTTPSVFGLGPSSSGGITNTDSSATSATLHQTKHLFCSLGLTMLLLLLLSGPMLFFSL